MLLGKNLNFSEPLRLKLWIERFSSILGYYVGEFKKVFDVHRHSHNMFNSLKGSDTALRPIVRLKQAQKRKMHIVYAEHCMYTISD